MTRNGKIARLPRSIRDELNERLSDGEPGIALVTWLNEHPEVREVLDLYFDGRPVSEQNLSEWKQGGFRDWQRHQMMLQFARTAAEEGEELQEVDDLDGETGVAPLSDRVAPLAVTALVRMMRSLMTDESEPTAESRRELRAVIRELSAMRFNDHRAARLRMDLRRWAEEKATLEKDAEHRRLWDPIQFYTNVQNREATIRDLVRGMSPEQEARLRRMLQRPFQNSTRPACTGGARPSADPSPSGIDGDGI